jgi:hypothetical protein
MLDREQQLIEAATRYLALLDGPQPISIHEFVASVEPGLREELAEYLQFVLATAEPREPIVLSAEEQALAERVSERTRVRARQRMATMAPARSLSALRKERRLSLGSLARQLDLPVDLLHRVERGGVVAATIPAKLISRLGVVLRQAEADVRAALAVPPTATGATRLSARDGTTIEPEQPVDFADALAASTATDAQKAEWA